MSAARSPGARAALIILLTVVAYLPTLRAGFVFDDYQYITDNRIVKASDGLYRSWFTTEPLDYYPLTSSLWWLEWRLWGNNATGYHAVNVLLHAANAVLVWMILRRLKIPGAWLAALVFAVHPVNVATVAWISEQKNTLSMLFFAMAILLYLRFDERGRWGWYGLSLAAFLSALLSKTAVVMLPIVLLGCVWWTRTRLRGKDLLRTVAFFVLSLAFGLVTIWFQHYRALEGRTAGPVGFASRLAMAGWVPWFYLSKALLPLNLTVVYPKWEIDVSRWFAYVPGMILAGGFVLFWWKRKSWGRPWLFGLGYFVVMLFPVMGFFDQGFFHHSLVADHWQYCPIVGVIALACAAGERVFRRLGERRRSWRAMAGAAVVLVLGSATWSRSRVYANDETLWRDNVVKTPDAWLPHFNLALALQQAGRNEDAIGQYEQELRIYPDHAEAHNNLGNILLRAGRNEEARKQYERALEIKPDEAQAHYNLGIALERVGKQEASIRQYQQALQIQPDYARAHYNLGVALEHAGKAAEAMEHYRQALRVDPDYADAHYNLAILLERAGQSRRGRCAL